jgi:hypothetical protein|tara:strand:+ start:81 stop:677 length:597 start_codon:yes stop_codon:yes gene_type:complete
MYKPIDMDTLKLNQNFKWVVEKSNFFTQEDCDFFIKYIDEQSERKQGHYTGGVNPTWQDEPVMKDEVCMLNISRTEEQKYLDKFWTAIKIADQMIYKYNIKGIYDNRLQAHRYDVGDWYNQHSDFHPIKRFSSVKLTCIVFLNTDYEGGEFTLFDGTKIEKEVGKLIIHPSFAGHGVSPITKGNRYSCVCWGVGDTFV